MSFKHMLSDKHEEELSLLMCAREEIKRLKEKVEAWRTDQPTSAKNAQAEITATKEPSYFTLSPEVQIVMEELRECIENQSMTKYRTIFEKARTLINALESKTEPKIDTKNANVDYINKPQNN